MEKIVKFDFLEDLANSVILLACRDYIEAYKKNNFNQIKELENYFYSKDFSNYSLGNIEPTELIKKLREKVDSKNNTEFRLKKVSNPDGYSRNK